MICPRALLRLVAGLALVATASPGRAKWTEGTIGRPLIQRLDTRTLNQSTDKWMVTQDRHGRIFTCDDQMHVFDGEAWHTFSVPGSYAVRTLLFDEADRLWVSGFNEVGYFEEKTPGAFVYHSLSDQLPADRALGHIWGSALVGSNVFFICERQVLRWDGRAFRAWEFPGQRRLFPVKHRGETWFHHVATGLYRLTADGPVLIHPAKELPLGGIFALEDTPQGLLAIGGSGLFRVGEPTVPVHGEALNRRIADARLTAAIKLPTGEFALATLTQGIFLVDAEGRTRPLGEGPDGLPAGPAIHLHLDARQHVWGIVHNTLFHFDASSAVSAFDERTGLTGNTVQEVRSINGQLHAVGQTGISRLTLDAPGAGARFEPLPLPKQLYYRLEPVADGFLALRYGGVDWVHGGRVDVTNLPSSAVFGAQARPKNRTEAWLSTSQHLAHLALPAAGEPALETVVALPDEGGSLHEDTTGRLWLSTSSRGVFTYEPATKQLRPFRAPTRSPGLGVHSRVIADRDGIFVFLPGEIFHTAADGSGVTRLPGLPAVEVSAARALPDGHGVVVAFTQAGTNELLVSGLARLHVDTAGAAHWQELDPAAALGLGRINALEFSREGDRDVLWTASSRGVLRLDFAALAPAPAPRPPIIGLATTPPAAPAASEELPAFAFAGHRVGFAVYTPDAPPARNWFTQVRLGTGEWSAPAHRARYEFTNLSEGDYRFEIRAVSPAGVTSAPSGYAFRILPPWYRSGWAYSGYALAVVAGGFAVIRLRERRSRARTRELEDLVKLRTHELEKASAAKDEFLATISHEIRNPMNGVIGIAESFDTTRLDAAARHKFTLLRECASHLSSLLEDILDLSRAQAGRIDLETVAFDPHELVASIAAITAGESARAGLPVEVAVSPGVPHRVLGDPRRVRQILLNLVGNALKFAGRGTIEVTAWCEAAGPDRTQLFITVADEGPGIAPDEQAKLFQRFERGAAAVARGVAGTGLGLALGQRLAEKMGGRLWVESEPGRGACFYFSAPFAIVPDNAPAAPAAGPRVSSVENPMSRRALVVDDEEYNRVALSDLLASAGLQVTTAANGPAALTLARAHAYDVIFLDHQLPDMSGVEIARALRASGGASARAPLVATTAFASEEKRAECVAAGMTSFLDKPVTAARLRAVLHALFDPASRTLPAPTPDDEEPASPEARLRQLAEKTGRAYGEELTLFLGELETALAGLHAAVATHDAVAASGYVHQLYGGLAFVGAHPAAELGRMIERDIAMGDWARAQEQTAELSELLHHLQANLSAPK